MSQKKIGIIMSYLNIILGCIIPIFYTPVMLNILGQAEYGIYSLSQSITSYLNLLNFGMTTTVGRYIVKYKSEDNKNGIQNIIGLFSIIYIILSILILCIGMLLAMSSNSLFSEGLSSAEIHKLKILIILMTLSIPLSLLGSIYSSLILSFEKFIFKYFIDVLGTLLVPVLNLILLYMGYASIGMACCTILCQLIFFPINIIYCKKNLDIQPSFKSLPFDLLKEIFSFSFVVFLSSIADLLFWATDKVLIGAVLGSVQVAIYNIGGTFISIFQNITSVISSVFSPQASTIVFKNKPIEESTNLMIKVGRIQYLIVGLILSGFVVFGKDFLIYWAGNGYEDSYYVALLTMFPIAIPLIQNIAFSTTLAMNKITFRSYVYIFIALINVISTYLVLPYFGIIGAAVCTALSFVIGQGVVLNIYYHYVIKLDMINFWKNILYMSFVPVLMSIIFSVILISFPIKSFFQLFEFIILYTILYCIFSWIFSMNEYEKKLILSCINKAKIRLYNKN